MGLILWLLVSLISISLIGSHPLLALISGAIGGAGIGVFLFRQNWLIPSPQLESYSPPLNHRTCLSFFLKYEFFISLPFVFILFFSKRIPFVLSLGSIVLLVCFWGYQRWKRFSVPTPVDLPVFLLLLLPATVGLYASPDLRLSLGDAFGLVASVLFFFVLINQWTKIEMLILWGIILGAALTLGLLFVMQVPPVKFSILGRIFWELPNLLPRKIHPNYAGGMLVFFLPLSVWGLIFFKKKGFLVALGAIILGLLLTQSRGALLGASVALILTMIFWFRWMFWVVGVLFVCGGVLIYSLGVSFLLDPVGSGNVYNTWVGREELFQRAIYIIQDFSFTGIGLHSFGEVVDLLYPLFLAGPNVAMPHAHNFFLQVAVDMGIPGYVAFWMLLGSWGSIVWDLLKRTAPGLQMASSRPLVLGVMGGMVAHLVYGLTDAIALGEKAGILFWMNLALTVSLWQLLRSKKGSFHE